MHVLVQINWNGWSQLIESIEINNFSDSWNPTVIEADTASYELELISQSVILSWLQKLVQRSVSSVETGVAPTRSFQQPKQYSSQLRSILIFSHPASILHLEYNLRQQTRMLHDRSKVHRHLTAGQRQLQQCNSRWTSCSSWRQYSSGATQPIRVWNYCRSSH